MIRFPRVLLTTIACLLFVLAGPTRATAAQITLAWDANTETDIAGYIVEYGPLSALYTQSADIGNTTTWTLANVTAGVTYGFRFIAYNANGERSDASGAIFASSGGPVGATIAADRSGLAFGVVDSAPQAKTAAQSIRLTQTGAGTVTWTASSSAAWLQVSPASGSGSGILTVSLVPGAIPPASASATITITTGGAANTLSPIPVSLNVLTSSGSRAPAGAVDSPADNQTGVTGSMAITGWAIDDVDVTRIRILRDPVAGEPAGLVYVGDGMLVEDARPDVAALYPTNPQSYRAGWGYLLLTNMLPALGNGTFRFSVYADDPEGHATLLGTRTVTCANASATQPFGAIDTPAPGETVAGTSYTSFGWVLAPAPNRADVPGGGTVSAVIDGVIVGAPAGWSARPDLTSLFPAGPYPGISRALAAFVFDTTTLSNGIHTMSWVVFDNQGVGAGVGSRYFRVFNGTGAPLVSAASSVHTAVQAADQAARAVSDVRAIDVRRGYAPDAPFRRYEADGEGRVTVQSEELDRIELRTNGATEGFLLAGNTPRPLPIGSHFDPATGEFVWQPGVGFVGAYNLVFVRDAGGRPSRQDVRIVLNPKGSNRVGPQIITDLVPAGGDTILAGWAADLDSSTDRGIDTIHVWAYPVSGEPPVFVGEAAYGGERADVAAVYGDRFLRTGYGLRVDGLAPGTYDLGVFAWSTARHEWLPAKVVRVAIR